MSWNHIKYLYTFYGINKEQRCSCKYKELRTDSYCHTPEIMNRIRGAKIPPRTHDETCVRKAKWIKIKENPRINKTIIIIQNKTVQNIQNKAQRKKPKTRCPISPNQLPDSLCWCGEAPLISRRTAAPSTLIKTRAHTCKPGSHNHRGNVSNFKNYSVRI
jgi:hypothetical protein